TVTLSIVSSTQAGNPSSASPTSSSNRSRDMSTGGTTASSHVGYIRPMPGGLRTDLYELNMAVSYLRRGMTGPSTFSLYVRKLPKHRGFLVAAGLQDCLDLLEDFSFEEDDLRYLGTIGFDDRALEDLAGVRFDGDVWAVPEGTIVHADEPILEVTAPIAVAQLVETALLNRITLHTTLASKAARYVLAAEGRDLVDFSFRPTHGMDAAMAAARSSAIVGFAATSDVAAARGDGFGVGAQMGASAAAPYLDTVYKLVQHDGRSSRKLSAAKASPPGPKQIWRSGGEEGDVLGLRDDDPPAYGWEPLLEPVMQDGSRLRPDPPLRRLQHRFQDELVRLPTKARRLSHPEHVAVGRSPALAALTVQTQADALTRVGLC